MMENGSKAKCTEKGPSVAQTTLSSLKGTGITSSVLESAPKQKEKSPQSTSDGNTPSPSPASPNTSNPSTKAAKKRKSIDLGTFESELSSEDIKLITNSKISELLHYNPGDIILKESEKRNYIFCLRSGEVHRVKTHKGVPVVAESLSVNSFFGVMAIFDLSTPFRYVAAVESEVYKLEISELYRSFATDEISKRFNLQLAKMFAWQLTHSETENTEAGISSTDENWEGGQGAKVEEEERRSRRNDSDTNDPTEPAVFVTSPENRSVSPSPRKPDHRKASISGGESPKPMKVKLSRTIRNSSLSVESFSQTKGFKDSLEGTGMEERKGGSLLSSFPVWNQDNLFTILEDCFSEDVFYRDPFSLGSLHGKKALLHHLNQVFSRYPVWSWLPNSISTVNSGHVHVSKVFLVVESALGFSVKENAVLWVESLHHGLIHRCELTFDTHPLKENERLVREEENGTSSRNLRDSSENSRPRSRSQQGKNVLIVPSSQEGEDDKEGKKKGSLNTIQKDDSIKSKGRTSSALSISRGSTQIVSNNRKSEESITIDEKSPTLAHAQPKARKLKKERTLDGSTPPGEKKSTATKVKRGHTVVHQNKPRTSEDKINPITLPDPLSKEIKAKNSSPRGKTKLPKRDRLRKDSGVGGSSKEREDAMKSWCQRFDLPEQDRYEVIREFQCQLSLGTLLPNFTNTKKSGTLYITPKYLCYFSGFFGMSSKEVIPVKAIESTETEGFETTLTLKINKKRARETKSRFVVLSSQIVILFSSYNDCTEAGDIIEQLSAKNEHDDTDVGESPRRIDSFIQQKMLASNLDTTIPNMELCESKSSPAFRISGPSGDEDPPSKIETDVCAISVSTYPRLSSQTPEGTVIVQQGRQGDPICDQFCLERYQNRTIFAIADGCNWGQKVKTAARIASQTFVEFNKKSIFEAENTQAVLRSFMQSFVYAHHRIIEGHEDSWWECGTTTLLGGSILELPEAHKWAFLCLAVGDCKAYHVSVTNGVLSVSNVTEGARTGTGALDARDCGGRLGPHKKGNPDLRNLATFFKVVDEGDFIVVSSDGVYDNLDPQSLGVELSETGIPGTEGKSWVDLTDSPSDQPLVQLIEEYKSNYTLELLKKLFMQIPEESGVPLKDITPQHIAQKLITYSQDTTKNIRDFMEQNPNNAQPPDSKNYPGKVDHATCVVMKVGKTNFRQHEADLRDLVVRLRHPTYGLTKEVEGTQKEVFKGRDLVRWIGKDPGYSEIPLDFGQALLNLNYICPVTSNDSFIFETFDSNQLYQFKVSVPIMTHQDWKIILQGTTRRTYRKGDIIIQEGTDQQQIYQITFGTCHIEKKVIDKNNKVKVLHLGTIGAPQTMGEVSILHGSKASASVIAASNEVEVMILDRHFIKIMFVRYPYMAGRFYHYLASVLARRLSFHESGTTDN
eukprot:TRINITY_DN11142_c0_g1_i1.p1 TRINITY_DN11142_c0_g1~~TRINITY_DN11142_c0_g1_i1.p1  ORF type:complete len:1417 (-),score=314.61 TRINITY_DN11142_c0_g1_i1:21-4271(-)